MNTNFDIAESFPLFHTVKDRQELGQAKITLKLYYHYAKKQHIDYEIVALENGSKDIRIHFLSSDFMPSLVLL